MNANAPRSAVDAGVVADAAAAAATLAFGVQASVVCLAEVLADQALFALDLDYDAHARRQEIGVGLDRPRSGGHRRRVPLIRAGGRRGDTPTLH